jgi:S1-C subfamily serine protease
MLTRIPKVVPIVLAPLLVSALLYQAYAALHPHAVAAPSSSHMATERVVLTSCDSEALGVAVAEVRAAVVYITGHPTSPEPADSTSLSAQAAGTPSALTADRMGSGVIFDSRGYILTNYHVVANTTNIRVSLFGEQERYPAQLVAVGSERDLAVLKISTGFALPTAPFGNSDLLEVGEPVLAVGCPFNLEQSVSHGVVSDTKRSVVIEGRQYRDLIQTDAAINSGNSGGALINTNGEVVGINVAIYAPNRVHCGVGFAIPVNQARWLLMTVQYAKSPS